MNRRGFTILELLLVLIFVSTVAALAIPAFFSRPSITLENASVLLARDLRTAQNRSAYLAEESRMEFLRDGSGYRVTDLSGEVVRNPRTGEDFERIYPSDGVFRGVTVTDVWAGDDWTVNFDDRGLPTESAPRDPQVRRRGARPEHGRVPRQGDDPGFDQRMDRRGGLTARR